MLSNLESEDNICLKKDDVEVEWFSGTGKGGQHRNKHQNSCRVIHRQSGIIESRQGRHRGRNLEEAMIAIERRLNESIADNIAKHSNSERQHQIGKGCRSDKIRTYRFQHDQVVDHRSGKKGKCSRIMKGRFDLLWPS